MNPHEEYILDKMLTEARVMIMDGSPLELDPSQFSDCVTALINRTREAEKDAERYRWLRHDAVFTSENAPLVLFTDYNADRSVFEFDGSLYSVLDGDVLDAAIDEAMKRK